MIKWDLSQGCKDFSVSANQSMWYITLTNWRIKSTRSSKSVQVSCSVVSDSLRPHGLQHVRLPCPSSLSHVWLFSTCRSIYCSLPGSFLCPWNFPGKNTGVGCHSILGGYSRPGNWTQVFHTAGRFFTIWTTREETIMQTKKDFKTVFNITKSQRK